MKIECIKLCDGPRVIAVLKDYWSFDSATGVAPTFWYVNVAERGSDVEELEITEDIEECKQLFHCLEGSAFTGFLTFRGREYNDVVVQVVL